MKAFENERHSGYKAHREGQAPVFPNHMGRTRGRELTQTSTCYMMPFAQCSRTRPMGGDSCPNNVPMGWKWTGKRHIGDLFGH